MRRGSITIIAEKNPNEFKLKELGKEIEDDLKTAIETSLDVNRNEIKTKISEDEIEFSMDSEIKFNVLIQNKNDDKYMLIVEFGDLRKHAEAVDEDSTKKLVARIKSLLNKMYNENEKHSSIIEKIAKSLVAWDDYDNDDDYEVDVPSKKEREEMEMMLTPKHGGWDGHPVWDKLTSEEKHEMQRAEKGYKHWGSGPYIDQYIAHQHGFHHVKLIHHQMSYSDSAYRQWKDMDSGAVFWDFLEG
jgi:hypothetical protein